MAMPMGCACPCGKWKCDLPANEDRTNYEYVILTRSLSGMSGSRITGCRLSGKHKRGSDRGSKRFRNSGARCRGGRLALDCIVHDPSRQNSSRDLSCEAEGLLRGGEAAVVRGKASQMELTHGRTATSGMEC
eukprot:4589029-Prymnesium_polylepis.1